MTRNVGLLRSTVALAGVICVLSMARGANAYNQLTHQRIVEAAVEAMIDVQRTPVPTDVDPAEWSAYATRLVESTDKLKNLQTGLDGIYKFAGFSGPLSPTNRPVGSYNDPEVCGYHTSTVPDRDLNLLNVEKIRIKEFPYYPNKDFVPCSLTHLPLRRIDGQPTPPTLGGSLGPTLGWHAQNIDNRVGDSVLWARPTNAGVQGLVKEMATRALEFSLGAVLVPFVCLAELLFSDDGCNVDDAFDLATRLDPITLVEGIVPGFGDISGHDYVGLWHFIDVGASFNRYNDVRGMLYEQAGPFRPSAVDVGIMALADLSGLSLNAFTSEGPERYGAFDRVERTVAQWQAHTIGHTEFSPLDNLARVGWDGYVADPTSAWYLSWPLHAVGDAAAPQHVVGTTGWGHRPFEEAVDHMRGLLLPASDDDLFALFRDRVLRIGFDASRAFQSDPSIQAFITREAQATRDIARRDGDWVYQDDLSVGWQADTIGMRRATEAVYENQLERIRPFVELSVGYTIALLARAGELVRDPGFDPQTLCPVGGHFTGEGPGCADGPVPPPASVEPLPPGLSPVTGPGFCQLYGQTCQVSDDCCNGVPCIGGRCRYP